MIGIYRICLGRGGRNFYIGQTQNFKKRFMNHRYHLRNGTHHSTPLQTAYDKYGEDKLSMILLEECEVEDLTAREQHYLDTLRPRYNPKLVAAPPPMRGKKHTKRAVSKIINAVRKFSEAQELEIISACVGLSSSYESVALKFKCSEQTIRNIMKKRGVGPTPRKPAKKVPAAGRTRAAPTEFSDAQTAEIVRLYTLEERTTTYIAGVFDSKHYTIGNVLRSAGVALRNVGSKRLLTDKQERQALAFRAKGRSVSEVAAKFGCSPQAMRNILNKHWESA